MELQKCDCRLFPKFNQQHLDFTHPLTHENFAQKIEGESLNFALAKKGFLAGLVRGEDFLGFLAIKKYTILNS